MKNNTNCEWCNNSIYKRPIHLKLFKHHFCSSKCRGIWDSKYKIKDKHPLYVKRIKIKCDNCDKILFRPRWRLKLTKHNFCNYKCRSMWCSKHKSGKNSPCYIDGSCRLPYPIIFSHSLRESIRKRDKYICQECGVPQIECFRKLDVHHIDYNKNNCEPYNLISLCNKCNISANKNRRYWKKHFDRKIRLLKGCACI